MGNHSAAGDVRGNGAGDQALHTPAREAEMIFWPWILGAFLCGAFLGTVLTFIAVAEAARLAAKRDLAYTVRKDDAAKYWSEL